MIQFLGLREEPLKTRRRTPVSEDTWVISQKLHHLKHLVKAEVPERLLRMTWKRDQYGIWKNTDLVHLLQQLCLKTNPKARIMGRRSMIGRVSPQLTVLNIISTKVLLSFFDELLQFFGRED